MSTDNYENSVNNKLNAILENSKQTVSNVLGEVLSSFADILSSNSIITL